MPPTNMQFFGVVSETNTVGGRRFPWTLLGGLRCLTTNVVKVIISEGGVEHLVV